MPIPSTKHLEWISNNNGDSFYAQNEDETFAAVVVKSLTPGSWTLMVHERGDTSVERGYLKAQFAKEEAQAQYAVFSRGGE